MIHRQDDTFVIDFNGQPYHITPEYEPKRGMYESTLVSYQANPDSFEEEISAIVTDAERQRADIYALLDELYAYLTSTDYIALKLAEGAATPADYVEELVKRQEAREQINTLQAELEEISNV